MTTITLKDGTTANVYTLYHYYQAKRELDALKEEYPEVAKRLFAEDKSDDEGDKGEEYYKAEDILEEAYHKLWNEAELAVIKGLTVKEFKILTRHATASNLKWNGQEFVSLDA